MVSDIGVANPAGEDETKTFDNTKNVKWNAYRSIRIIQNDFTKTKEYRFLWMKQTKNAFQIKG